MGITHAGPPVSKRLLSLDFMRGLIMILLMLESTRLYDHLDEASTGTYWNGWVLQFMHHPWHGLHFWDLIQPGFMFMAGVSVAFSLQKQKLNGIPWSSSFRKILRRCGWLFFWGVMDYAVQPRGLSLDLTDVLTQLSFTTLVAFLIFRWTVPAQIVVCAGLLLVTEILYRFTHIPGYDQPFINQHNFGNYVDRLLTNQTDPDGWVSVNCIPTAVHTIAGALTGRLLSGQSKNKLSLILKWGLICLTLGFFLDVSGVTPIIKKIATSSFTLASLGFCLLAICLFYWWIDCRNHRRHTRFFTIVGMNSIFIYLFIEIVGSRFFNAYIVDLTGGLPGLIHTPAILSKIISSLCIFALEWGICYWLYKKAIFFRL
ncbi:MAG: DUF5009 domain-containing protein [Bacteroidota bacterium]|nr:DUF5009 domain-containing protein [Bacteroidota bacterium]